ncbi:MAG: AAA family ATPase [Methylomonas sp.]|jgi:hypothetical protein|uniref:AAA family ATPase n=1 Tax=Methylomonas sp. TaxID=418 RepID=UPI0025CFFAFA|nr:AAA family ATPase [Methylomonas sp.]MCK9606156.1 AAA family ATPase [Methylomonas sp.]
MNLFSGHLARSPGLWRGAALWLVLLLCCSAVHAQAPISACADKAELMREWETRRDNLLKIKAGLESFAAGRSIADLPLSALFVIDLNDAGKVAQRAEELRQSLAAVDAGAPADPLLPCLAQQNLQDDFRQLHALLQDIARLRLQFLQLPTEKRAAILHPQIEATEQAGVISQLQQEHRSAIQDQKQSAVVLAKVEQQVLTAESGEMSELASVRAELERTRGELTALQVKWVGYLEKQAVFYQQTSEKLAEIGKYLLQPTPIHLLELQYDKSLLIWRELVDKTPRVVSGRFAMALPVMPDFAGSLVKQLADTPEAKRYQAAYLETQATRDLLQDKIGSRLQQSVDLHYRVLLQSGEIRSQLLNVLLDRHDNQPLRFSLDLLKDLEREIAIVPYRWMATFYLRWLDIQQRLREGWEGVAEIGFDAMMLLGFLLIPWLVWLVSKVMSYRLDLLRVQLVRRSRRQPNAIHLALAIQKIQPYSAWLLMLLAVYAGQHLLAITLFAELAIPLNYLKYYLYYRLFRQLMQCDFMWLNKHVNPAKFAGLRREVNLAAKALGILALLIFSLMFAIESLIRRGLVYHFSIQAFSYLGVLLAMGLAYQWRVIVAEALKRFLPGFLGERFAKACVSRWALFAALPGFAVLLVMLVLRIVRNWLSRFEFVRRIAAEVFRLQLESGLDKRKEVIQATLPAEYRQGYVFAGVASAEQLQPPAMEGLEEIHALLNGWREGNSWVHSLAIVGHKGIGKTCLLEYLEQSFQADRVLRVAVPKKLTTRKQVLALLGEALGLGLSGKETALTAEMVGSQTVLFIDDAHNLFLSTQGGFEGFKTLLSLMTQSSHKLFWCLTFNHHAWNYLNSVNGRHQYFGEVYHLKPWSEKAVQSLILKMHEKTGYRLSYDDIIQAAGSQSYSSHVTYIENRFFNLLWQQARGNPRLAVYLWLSALRQVAEQSLRVGLPEDPDTSMLGDLSDDSLFVFASIALHENITLPQLLATTQLPEGVVKPVLDEGRRMKLLDCQDTVYRLSVLYHYPVVRYLQAKHCLYE